MHFVVYLCTFLCFLGGVVTLFLHSWRGLLRIVLWGAGGRSVGGVRMGVRVYYICVYMCRPQTDFGCKQDDLAAGKVSI